MDTTFPLTARYRQLLTRFPVARPISGALSALALTLTPVAACLAWVLILRGADTRQISDLGLITAIPPVAFVALFALLVSFSIAINQERLRRPILLLHVVLLIMCLYGAAILVEGQPRTAIAWKLVGIMDQIMRYGSVDPNRDAFQNWPGFFGLVAFISRLAGIASPLVLAAWAHVFFNLLYLGPLLLLFRAGTQDERLTWMGIWLFYLCNWIGQDYLAPQALGYFFYLLTLGVLLTWFRGGSGLAVQAQRQLSFLPARWRAALVRWFAPERGVENLEAAPARKTGLLAVVLVILLVMVPSHQLTPVALLAAITGLVIAGRIAPRGLPLILGILIVAFISFMTVPYLRGHLDNFTQPFGDITANVNDNVTARVRGSPLHHFVVLFRIGSSLAIWLIAALGVWRRVRAGYRDFTFLLLAGVPFGLLGLQTYGGELLLRTFLFSLPFVAFFMAALFVPRPAVLLSPLKGLAFLAVCAALGVSFFVTRYGNERMDYFTDEEVGAMQFIYATSGPGTHIVSGTEALPWRYEEYNTDRYSSIERAVRTNDLEAALEVMRLPNFEQAFLVLSRSQQAAAELYLGWEPGAWERFADNVAQSDKFQLVFSNADAQVYVLAPGQAEAGPRDPDFDQR